MAVKHLENYATIRWTRKNSDLIEKEILSLSQSTASVTTIANSKELMEIEKHLTKAHELYATRLFGEAIEEYRTTQAMIYKFLNPAVSVDILKDPEFTINIDHNLFENLLNKNMDLIAQLDPKYLETTPLVIKDIIAIDPEKPDFIPSAGIKEFKEIQVGRSTRLTKSGRIAKNTSTSNSTIKKVSRMLGINAGDKIVNLTWEVGKKPSSSDVINKIYAQRTNLKNLAHIICKYFSTEDFAVMLPHIMSYVIPAALGDCYHELGDYNKAEKNYLTAADYKYINQSIEVPSIWIKLAENALSWGDMYYKDDNYQDALSIYRKVLEAPGTAAVVNSESYLYKHTALKTVGDKIQQTLTTYGTNIGNSDINPQLATVLLLVKERLTKLSGGLDFLGIPIQLVPVWTFEYLQNVSRYFTQQAIQAEREYINFTETADNKKLTRQQLKQAVDLAKAEISLAQKQKETALNERQVYQEGYELAAKRQENAQNNKNAYASMSWEKMWLDAGNAWYNGPDYNVTGTGKKAYEILYDNAVRSGTIARDYELGAMDRQISELAQAAEMAEAQLLASQSRVEAARLLENVAILRASSAAENLKAFDDQTFTSDVWAKMGNFMKSIRDSYLTMAISTSRLMQKAYNFEFDTQKNCIKANYTAKSVDGLLASNALLLDIDSFTYDMVTSVKTKSIPVKQTLSLASRYPYLFESEFRKTGTMIFETRLEDFDMDYPGTYSRRIETIEVIVEGLLPSGGVKGFLTNSGVSRYRTPMFGNLKFRIQPTETLILSEYKIAGDSFVFNTDSSKLKLFEGSGVAGSWKLEIPKFSNDIDYNYITDVKIVFCYSAFYDASLAQAVKNNIKNLAAVNKKSKILPLRFSFPDSYYNFQDNGVFSFNLDKSFFPYNESNQKISNLSLFVKDSNANSKLTVCMGVPSHSEAIKAQTGAQGEITAASNHPWNTLLGSNALGEYVIEIRKEDNPSVVSNDKLLLETIEDLVLVIEYDYTPEI